MFTGGWHDLFVLLAIVAIFIGALFASVAIIFAADRISNPNAVEDWQLAGAREKILRTILYVKQRLPDQHFG